MKIKFLGATQTVTGSKHLLKGNNHNILIDCGLYQGPDADKYNKEIPQILETERIDAIILTHAHLDHSGYLPKFYKDGFRGPIFCTAATKDLASIILSDNAQIQAQNAKSINKKITKTSLKVEPLYTQTEVNQVLANFVIKPFNEEFTYKEFHITLKKAGHILGAASPLISCKNKSIRFTGDLGRNDDLVVLPPDPGTPVDFLVMESTYGNRIHSIDDLNIKFQEIFKEARKKNSCVLIPAFSVGRSQTLMKALYEFFVNHPDLNLPVYVDSPMTQAVTEVYNKYLDLHKIPIDELKKFHEKFHFIKYKSQKENLDQLNEAHIILTASGMLSGGNILHHLSVKGPLSSTYILIVGYQSADTLGAELLKGHTIQTLEDKDVTIAAEIINLTGFSSHADHNDLLAFAKECSPQKIFLTHGEDVAKDILKQDLVKLLQTDVQIPQIGDLIDLH